MKTPLLGFHNADREIQKCEWGVTLSFLTCYREKEEYFLCCQLILGEFLKNYEKLGKLFFQFWKNIDQKETIIKMPELH